MSVFDWRGPQFLLFYAAFGVALYFVARALRALSDPQGQRDPTPADDPYLVACLRDGVAEAIRVSIVSLVDRKLLVADGARLRSAAHANRAARRPIEGAILAAAVTTPVRVRDILRDGDVRSRAGLLRDELGAQGLWAVPRVGPGRLLLYASCAALAAWVALHKLELALERGRHNVFFLCVLLVLSCIALVFAVFPPRTAAGETHLRALQRLFARVYKDRENLRPGGESTELVWLCAVFGLDALSTRTFPALHQLFPSTHASASHSSSESSSACGGSASSCSGSSCGGGCGGCGGGGD